MGNFLQWYEKHVAVLHYVMNKLKWIATWNELVAIWPNDQNKGCRQRRWWGFVSWISQETDIWNFVNYIRRKVDAEKTISNLLEAPYFVHRL